MLEHARTEHAYATWAERLVAEGWTPYLMTFMFQPIGGSAARVAEVMEAEVIRVYATFLPWVVRHPTRASSLGRHPVWMCAPDFPVHKRRKSSLRDVVVNDGRHMHASAFQPPESRLCEDLPSHFESRRGVYVRPGFALERINVQPVTHAVGLVTDYVRKSITRGREGEDATLILPRSLSEM